MPTAPSQVSAAETSRSRSSTPRTKKKTSGRSSRHHRHDRHRSSKLGHKSKRHHSSASRSRSKRRMKQSRHQSGREVDESIKMAVLADSRKNQRRRERRSPPSSSASTSGRCRSLSQESSAAESEKVAEPVETVASACKPLSLRAFAKQELTGKEMPEEAIEKYKLHQKLCAEKALEALKDSNLLFDYYNPISARKAHDLRVQLAKRNAQVFVAAVNEGSFAGLCLCAKPSQINNGQCQTLGHMRAPHFAFDPDVNSLLIKELSPAASIWSIPERLHYQPGLLGMSVPHPGVGRDVRMRFQTLQQAEASHLVLSSSENMQSRLQAELVKGSDSICAVVAPLELSRPEQIDKYCSLSARVIRKLDSLIGIPAEMTDAVLNKEAKPEEKLDLQTLYLRRVHHFCFHKCEWCHDEWDLRQRSGPCPPLRVISESGDSVPEVGEWAEALEAGLRIKEHEQCIEKFLDKVTLERPPLPSMQQEPLRSCVLALCEERTVQAAPTKFQCTVCKKCFRGPDYTHKHLQKVHAEIFQPVHRQACQDAANAAFLADPKRPLP